MRRILLILSVLFTGVMGVILGNGLVFADEDPACASLSDTQKAAMGCGTSGTVSDVAIVILNVAIGLIGVVAVVVMVLGGITFTTSSGDAAKIKKAKDTIIYGLIGLVVAILSFAIVNFVSAAISS